MSQNLVHKASTPKIIFCLTLLRFDRFVPEEDRPTAYYQNPWFVRILRIAYWSGPSSKGFSDDHTSHFNGISYALLAFVVTTTEKMLAVVAAGSTGKKDPESKFSHDVYSPRFDSHLMTLLQLHQSVAGPRLTAYLTQVHQELRGSNPTSIIQNPAPKLAIPLSALINYGMETGPPPVQQDRSVGFARSSNTQILSAAMNPNIDLDSILNNPAWSAEQKLQIIRALRLTIKTNHLSHSKSTRSAQQFRGLWTNVAGESDNSEFEARRVGALTSNEERAEVTSTVDEDVEMSEGEGLAKDKGKSNTQSTGVLELGSDSASETDSDTKSENVSKPKGEVECNAEDADADADEDEDEDNDEDDGDVRGVVVTDGDEVGCSGSKVVGIEGVDGDTSSSDTSDSDGDAGPSEPRELQSLSVGSDRKGVYSSECEEDSDGGGATGAAAAGDLTMTSVVESDYE
ncbi:hypothetical protein BDV93DRAFT_608115 [Ceratobasidium sp. AG-I]|nr:hypothetical protein BDV93DRAFT_608115 [Ceratobasidium sp. AG-I]